MDPASSMSIFGLAKRSHSTATTQHLITTPSAGENSAFANALSMASGNSNNTPAPATAHASASGEPAKTGDPGTGSLAWLNRLWELLPSDGTVNAASPLTFVQSIIGPARRAADQLGTHTAAVIAVAALETGWGKHMIQSASGEHSNNLFGIKATGNSSHKAVETQTSEFIDGIEHKVIEPFRSYPSISDSVADFADFIQSNPRYRDALSAAHNADEFIEQIHQAGYATDPDYAAKVRAVMTQVNMLIDSDPAMTVN